MPELLLNTNAESDIKHKDRVKFYRLLDPAEKRVYTKQTILTNESGLHARPAANFVALANTFESSITIRRSDQKESAPVNAKSILMVLTQGLTKNTPIEISAEGQDEHVAVDRLVELIETNLVG